MVNFQEWIAAEAWRIFGAELADDAEYIAGIPISAWQARFKMLYQKREEEPEK